MAVAVAPEPVSAHEYLAQSAPRPPCPRGHTTGTVWRDGPRWDTDKHATIMFVCDPGEGGARHRFTWPHRMRWEPHDPNQPFHCLACARAYVEGFGDHIGCRFDYAYTDIALTLFLAGQGTTFRKVAAAVRNEAHRWQDPNVPKVTSREAQLTQSYIDAFAPLLIDALAPKEWPAAIAIDALDIKRKAIGPIREKADGSTTADADDDAAADAPQQTGGENTTPAPAKGKVLGWDAKGGGEAAGHIFVAVDLTTQPVRPVRMQFSGGKDRVSWARFLTSMGGRISWIVADGDAGLEGALKDLGWLQEGTVYYRCEGHLVLNAQDAAHKDKLFRYKPRKSFDPDDQIAFLRRLMQPRRGRRKDYEESELFL